MCRNKVTRKFILPRTSILDPYGVYVLKPPDLDTEIVEQSRRNNSSSSGNNDNENDTKKNGSSNKKRNNDDNNSRINRNNSNDNNDNDFEKINRSNSSGRNYIRKGNSSRSDISVSESNENYRKLENVNDLRNTSNTNSLTVINMNTHDDDNLFIDTNNANIITTTTNNIYPNSNSRMKGSLYIWIGRNSSELTVTIADNLAVNLLGVYSNAENIIHVYQGKT